MLATSYTAIPFHNRNLKCFLMTWRAMSAWLSLLASYDVASNFTRELTHIL